MSNLETMYPAQANSPYTTTLGEIAANDTAVVVADASVLPDTVPFLLTLGYDKSASETVLVTAVANNTLTITRGVDGNALLWVAGTKVARIFTAKDLNDVQANLRKLNQDKQENLAFDTTPTAGSTNPVTSGGIREALNLKANAASLAKAKIEELEERRAAKAEKAKDIDAYINRLTAQNGDLTEFDERLWIETVDKVTIYHDGHWVFRFQNGAEIEA